MVEINEETEASRWLTGLILGASALIAEERKIKTRGTIIGPKGIEYDVGEKIGASERYNLYQCILPGGRCGVLKIAVSAKEHNPLLDREALVLKLMRDRSDELEAANKSWPYNYHFFFPEIVESFISVSQQNRRINVLGFQSPVDYLGQLEPLSYIVERDKMRVDPKTSAWIIGKVLKLKFFAYDMNVVNKSMNMNNILFDKEKHGIIQFDWTLADAKLQGNLRADCQRELMDLGKIATMILGGDHVDGSLPESDQLADKRYESFIRRMANGDMADAGQAHEEFYALIRNIWPERGFHPFACFPL